MSLNWIHVGVETVKWTFCVDKGNLQDVICCRLVVRLIITESVIL